MSDSMFPSFQEPPEGGSALGRDEVPESTTETVHDPFDLSTWMDNDERLLGFVGSLKYIDGSGALKAVHVQVFLDDYESLGLHQRAMREINDRIDMEAYVYDQEDED